MDQSKNVLAELPNISAALKSVIGAESELKFIPANTQILRAGQFIKVVPIVIEGLIKVFTRHNDRELLLYYIQPNESCIMSFAGSLKNEPSRIFAVTEEDTKALLLPVTKLPNWIMQYPDINGLFYQQYNLRYIDLLDTINHVLFDKLDARLMSYLEEKIKLKNQNPIKLSHRQIANELGTAREVISRVMKKLEIDGMVKQEAGKIELVGR